MGVQRLDRQRSAEFNTQTNNTDTFPPEFGPTASRIQAGTANDPFRPETRLMLKNEKWYSGSITGDARNPRHKLNLNRILSGEVNR